MGVMNKLRDNTGVILWILVIAFGIIFMLQDTQMFDALQNQRALNIITVDGEGIPFSEYNARVDQIRNQISQQNPDAGPQELDEADEQAFESLVNERLSQREMERLGLTVTDEEIRQMYFGPNPHPLITMYFGNGQGGVDRAQLQAFVDAPETEPQRIELERYMRSERQQSKLSKLVESLARVSDAEVMAEYARRSGTITADVVGLRYASIPDSEVQLADADVRRYYDAHKDDYARSRTLDVAILSATKQPTAADTTLIRNDLQSLKTRFTEASNDSTFLADQASTVPYQSGYQSPGNLPAGVVSALTNAQPGAVVGPIFDNGVAYLAKLRGTRESATPAVRARHILIPAPQGDEAARQAARAQIESIRAQIAAGASFADMARQFSQDGSAASGGDLGWFGRGMMVAPFEEAAFNNPVGALVGPVETQFGIHLVEVTDKSSREFDVALYGTPVRADLSTLSASQRKLDDFRYFVQEENKLAQIEAEARDAGLGYQTQSMQVDQPIYPGIGRSRAVRRFLETAEEGALSEVIELNDQFVLLYVRDVTPEGYRPLAEVEDEVRTRALLEKKKAVAVEKLRTALAQGFEGLAGRAGGQQAVMSVTAQNSFVPGFGQQPRLAGAVSATPQGRTTGVVQGADAAFVARVTGKTEPSAITDAQKEAIRNELVTRRQARIRSQWMQGLREAAEVEDNRASVE